MHLSRRRLSWPGYVFYTLLALAGSSAIWFWPQSPRWKMIVPNPEKNGSKMRLLFFSEDSQRVFFTERDSYQASIVQLDAYTGKFLERVELGENEQARVDLTTLVNLGPVPVHYHRTLLAIHHQSFGKGLAFYDAVTGRKSGITFNGINPVYYSVSKSRAWTHYFAHDDKKQDRPDLIIADANTGEVVLRFTPESLPPSHSKMVYGWEAVFDPTERYVAIAWNSTARFSRNDLAEKHQSQIRIYDL